MEQTCLSDMQPFYEGTLIWQLNIHVTTRWRWNVSKTFCYVLVMFRRNVPHKLHLFQCFRNRFWNWGVFTCYHGNKQQTAWSLEAYCRKNPCYGFELVYKMEAFVGNLFISQPSDTEILFHTSTCFLLPAFNEQMQISC